MVRDYLERANQNQALGLAGELAVVDFERKRLEFLGHYDLAAKVEHVANSRGDGLGYDVLSYHDDGQEKMIEVKTTKYDKEVPFFVSQNEVCASAYFGESFHLYRVFQFGKRPGLFTLQGALEDTCRLVAADYKAVPKTMILQP